MRLILGTMTFGPQVDMDGARSMVERFFQAGYHELDTAHVYNNGETERMLGALMMGSDKGTFSIATKVHPRITGKLDRAAVLAQFDESLRRLNRDAVDLLYFHMPDRRTPIEDALEACAELHQQGRFKELGLSNFPAWLVVDIWYLCRERGWPQPTAYQGLYNGLSRDVEDELIPALRKLGIRFYAYNPLAGGMLSGKHINYDVPPPGRFDRLESYRNRYWKQAYFEAVGALVTSCRDAGIAPAEAAFRWLAHHSLLNSLAGDGIIIGASNMDQLEQNFSAFEKGVLPQAVVSAFDAAWTRAKPESPSYFRYYP